MYRDLLTLAIVVLVFALVATQAVAQPGIARVSVMATTEGVNLSTIVHDPASGELPEVIAKAAEELLTWATEVRHKMLQDFADMQISCNVASDSLQVQLMVRDIDNPERTSESLRSALRELLERSSELQRRMAEDLAWDEWQAGVILNLAMPPEGPGSTAQEETSE